MGYKESEEFKRTRMREYCRHGKSEKYFDLKNMFTVEQEEAVKHFTDKIVK